MFYENEPESKVALSDTRTPTLPTDILSNTEADTPIPALASAAAMPIYSTMTVDIAPAVSSASSSHLPTLPSESFGIPFSLLIDIPNDFSTMQQTPGCFLSWKDLFRPDLSDSEDKLKREAFYAFENPLNLCNLYTYMTSLVSNSINSTATATNNHTASSYEVDKWMVFRKKYNALKKNKNISISEFNEQLLIAIADWRGTTQDDMEFTLQLDGIHRDKLHTILVSLAMLKKIELYGIENLTLKNAMWLRIFSNQILYLVNELISNYNPPVENDILHIRDYHQNLTIIKSKIQQTILEKYLDLTNISYHDTMLLINALIISALFTSTYHFLDDALILFLNAKHSVVRTSPCSSSDANPIEVDESTTTATSIRNFSDNLCHTLTECLSVDYTSSLFAQLKLLFALTYHESTLDNILTPAQDRLNTKLASIITSRTARIIPESVLVMLDQLSIYNKLYESIENSLSKLIEVQKISQSVYDLLSRHIKPSSFVVDNGITHDFSNYYHAYNADTFMRHHHSFVNYMNSNNSPLFYLSISLLLTKFMCSHKAIEDLKSLEQNIQKLIATKEPKNVDFYGKIDNTLHDHLFAFISHAYALDISSNDIHMRTILSMINALFIINRCCTLPKHEYTKTDLAIIVFKREYTPADFAIILLVLLKSKVDDFHINNLDDSICQYLTELMTPTTTPLIRECYFLLGVMIGDPKYTERWLSLSALQLRFSQAIIDQMGDRLKRPVKTMDKYPEYRSALTFEGKKTVHLNMILTNLEKLSELLPQSNATKEVEITTRMSIRVVSLLQTIIESLLSMDISSTNTTGLSPGTQPSSGSTPDLRRHSPLLMSQSLPQVNRRLVQCQNSELHMLCTLGADKVLAIKLKKREHCEVIKALHIKNANGDTPLVAAAKNIHSAIFIVLIEYLRQMNFDIKPLLFVQQDNDGNTLLHLAINHFDLKRLRESKELIHMLIENCPGLREQENRAQQTYDNLMAQKTPAEQSALRNIFSTYKITSAGLPIDSRRASHITSTAATFSTNQRLSSRQHSAPSVSSSQTLPHRGNTRWL